MKKIIISFFIFFFGILNVHAITASSAVLMDMESNRVIYNLNMNDKRLIASITKIMTCIIAIENSDLNQDIIVGNEVLKAYGSAIYIEVGEKIKLSDLLYGLMLRSGNDAAIEIAYNVSGNIKNFVDLMNNKATEIGMKNTHFVNPHGLEESDLSANISTAYDMALLTSYAYKNDTFKSIFGTKSKIVKSNKKTYSWHNKNKILHTYNFITGGKTGYTEKAKRTLVTTAEKDNMKLVMVTLNDGNDFSDHINMYQNIFKNYYAKKMIDKELFSLSDCANCYVKNDYYVLVNDKEDKKIKINYVIEKNNLSDYVGKIVVLLDNLVLHEEIIYKNEPKIVRNNFLYKIIEWFKSW